MNLLSFSPSPIFFSFFFIPLPLSIRTMYRKENLFPTCYLCESRTPLMAISLNYVYKKQHGFNKCTITNWQNAMQKLAISTPSQVTSLPFCFVICNFTSTKSVNRNVSFVGGQERERVKSLLSARSVRVNPTLQQQ